jgi:putative DNA-invertase from lambdoid prophage Rac
LAQQNIGRVHGYTRVSSLEQAREGYSLGEQERQLREIAGRHHPDREFLLWSDPGVSGSVPLAERPQGGTMVQGLRGGDLVIATKLDRVFRDMRDALNQVEEFRARQIDCILLDICPDLKSITGQNSAGQFNFQVLAAAAQFERSRLRERLADSREARRRQGKPLGGNPPTGWSIENGFLVRNEHEQALLELIHALHREGRSLRAIADELERRGYRTRSGNPIGSSQISKLVRAQPFTSQLDKQSRADRIKAAIATKRAQGWKPGNPWLGEAAKRGTEALMARRAQRDAAMEPIIAKILATGVNSYQGVATMLNAARVPTLGNAAAWYPATVRQIMRRLNLCSPHQPGRPKKSAMTRPVGSGHKPPTTALTTPLRRFRDRRKRDILALREEGFSVPEIARKLKLRNNTMIYRILHEAEMPVGLQRVKAKEQEINAMRVAGRSVTEIGRAIGFHPRTIYRFLERQRHRMAAMEDGKDGFADEIMPVIWKLQAAGVVGRRALARELNERGVPARHGGGWTPGAVAWLIARHKSQQPVDLETQQAAGFALGVLAVISELRGAGSITLHSLTDELNKRGLRTIKGQFWTPVLVSAVCARAGWQLPEL